MSYGLSVLRRAQKELAHAPPDAYRRLVEAIRKLGEEPSPAGCRKLSGLNGWRIHVGDFSVIYEIEKPQ